MKVQWWLEQSEYDPAEFPETARYAGLEDVGEGVLMVVVEEDIFQVIFTADEGVASLLMSDGGWVEPGRDFRIVP